MTANAPNGGAPNPGAVIREERGPVWILHIKNEQKRNAFTSEMTASLQLYLEEAEAHRDVRCVVVTGAGERAFSSGHDLNEADWQTASTKDVNTAFVFPARMVKPTIAAVNGPAYAAGFVLALSCDLRVVSRNASFCASGARIGLLPVAGQISRLPLLLPPNKALELLMTGAPMQADEAFALGFANRLVDKGEALSQATIMAEAIARNSPVVVREVKRGVNTCLCDGITAARNFELMVGAKIKGGADHKEGVAAFLEKRTPVFRDVGKTGVDNE